MRYHPAKFGGHRHSDSRDIMVFVSRVALQDHLTRASCDLMVRSFARLSYHSSKFRGPRQCDSGDIMVLACH